MSKSIYGFNIDRQWDYENGFYLTSHTTRIAKLLAHYELYKLITRIPGHVVECGVYKGASLIRFATFRNLIETTWSRKVIGFDTFGEFPKDADAHDLKFINHFEEQGGHGIPVDELREALARKSIDNCELVKGDIRETVPRYLHENPELKICLLHIDVDVYEPSAVILDRLYDCVVTGGLIVLDDYGTVAGETRAVDEFIADRKCSIEKLSISHIPAFIRKT